MIQVDNLTFTYAGATTPAVHNLSFTVHPGEIFGFLGPSGAGKSTTQKILMRLLRDFTGQVQVLDKALRDWDQDYYTQVGVSFELPNHYGKLTALENLRYFAALYPHPTVAPQKLLDMVGLAEDGQLLASQFSKGMKIRLNLARALIHNPRLLFLDEPTAGLDPVNAHRIKELIKAQKAEGRTIFLTTHDMTIADALCDRVAFIVDGAISLIDSPRALKLRYGRREVRVEYLVNGHTQAQIFPLAGLADNAAFGALLRQDAVQTLHTQEATLENIFIQVTGRGLQ